MGVDKPNYTQVPNLLIEDLMIHMSEAELKVTLAISRQTFGYHRDRIKLSLSALQELTGLSRPTVVKGINEGIARGTITRTAHADGSYVYELMINGDCASASKESLLVNKVDQEPSKESLPRVVKNIDQASKESLPELVKNVNQNTPTLKKVLKKTKKKKVKESIAADAAPADPPEWQLFVSGLCNCCYKHTDISALSQKDKGVLLSEAKQIHDGGYTLDDIRKWFADEWTKDWRYGANKNRPTPSQVRSGIPAIRAKSDAAYELAPATNGNHSTSKTDRKRDAFANVERTLQERGML